MCGIYGYIGKQDAFDKVIKGLSFLQYRGYDSCGVAYYQNNKFNTVKTVGTLDKLNRIEGNTNLVFGHTRWATNGVVNVINAHPHISNDGNYTIVHNGIIKNSEEIKQELVAKGYSFYSETDTEVIANYISTIDINKDLNDIFNKLDGTYSLIVGCKNKDIYLIKEFSPLHILKAKDGIYISSDISSLPNGELYSLKDKDIIKISGNKIKEYNNKKIKFIPHKNTLKQMELGEFQHYMLKEIKETPQALFNTYNSIKDFKIDEIFRGIENVTLIGCGTAYNSCLIGEHFFKTNLKLKTNTVLASNYELNEEIENNHIHIIVSQSGETADCIKVAELVKNFNGKLMVLTNEGSSTLATMADYLVLTNAKKELAVASTKTYCCQVFIFAYFCQKLLDYSYSLNINSLVAELETFMNKLNVSDLANKLKSIDKLILIGKNVDYLTLLEASLKIREIDYVYTLPMFAGELKHGTLSLIEKGSVVLTLNSSNNTSLFSSTINEILSREGVVVEMENLMPNLTQNEFFKPIFTVIPFQLLSYEIAVLNGRNPDMPRNLAKSVTVE